METGQKENNPVRIKDIAGELPICKSIKSWMQSCKAKKRIARWEKSGRPLPPLHDIKQRVIRKYAERHDLKVLVETGTYLGKMVQAMLPFFKRIYSIELDIALYEKAREKFSDQGKVDIICGDSGIEIGKLLAHLDQPALFWLDGHYSKGVTAKANKSTPILEELTHIYEAKDNGHVVLIDDARFFGVDPDYPGVDEIKELVMSKRDNVCLSVEDDIIKIIPQKLT